MKWSNLLPLLPTWPRPPLAACSRIFFLKFQTPVTLCSGELWSILVVRLAHSADLRSRLRHVSSAPQTILPRLLGLLLLSTRCLLSTCYSLPLSRRRIHFFMRWTRTHSLPAKASTFLPARVSLAKPRTDKRRSTRDSETQEICLGLTACVSLELHEMQPKLCWCLGQLLWCCDVVRAERCRWHLPPPAAAEDLCESSLILQYLFICSSHDHEWLSPRPSGHHVVWVASQDGFHWTSGADSICPERARSAGSRIALAPLQFRKMGCQNERKKLAQIRYQVTCYGIKLESGDLPRFFMIDEIDHARLEKKKVGRRQ